MENEKRLIDANAMREDWLQNGENEYVYDTNAVLDSIDAQPTVDAVSRGVHDQVRWERDTAIGQLEKHGIPFGGIAPDVVKVVRCKDCKHFYHSISSDRDGRCVQFGTYDTDPSVYLNDFCSYGERKDNE